MLIATSNFRVLRRPIESAQYAAQIYRKMLETSDLIGSMGRRGNPYDNAKAESFMKTLKVEAVYPMAFETFDDVAEHLPRFIEEVYNHVNRVKGLLFSQGITNYEPLRKDRRQRLEELRTGDGRALPAHMKAQICRELDRLELLLEQIRAIEHERDTLIAAQAAVVKASPAKMLLEIKGIGAEFAAVLSSECLFRKFDNRRQVAAYAGLAPTHGRAVPSIGKQGVSKAGNPRLRTTLIQMSWLWLQHQPNSALTQWFNERVRRNGGRMKKSAIVALARKLLVALWKYVASGIVIVGAVMKRAR